MTFATPTSVAGYLSQKRHHVTKSTIISMSLPKSGIFPWPNHWRDEVMWCNSPKPIFHSLLFFFHVSRELHTSDASRFLSGQHRPDKEWLNLVNHRFPGNHTDSKTVVFMAKLVRCLFTLDRLYTMNLQEALLGFIGIQVIQNMTSVKQSNKNQRSWTLQKYLLTRTYNDNIQRPSSHQL